MTDVDWHAWRGRGIGGSDIGALLGLSNYASPYSLWCEKVGLLEPTETTDRQRVGQVMEHALGVLFHERTGLYVVGEQTWAEHPDNPVFRCTVDGFAVERVPSFDDENGPDSWSEDCIGTVQHKTDGRRGWPDGPPVSIRAQCVWEMGVTGIRNCWLSVMFSHFRYEVFEIPWDDDAEADWQLMSDRADRFWRDHVVTGTPPPIDGHDATADALARIWPNHVEGEAVELDDLADILTERSDLKEQIKADKERLAELDNRIRAAFGDAEVGTVAGIPLLTYRSQTRAAHVVAESTFRVLRAAPTPKQRTPT